ncbi:PAS domain-containing protein [Hyphomonas sp.]|uniref:PAS domain-containing protein n=1 Tax=Hyphomonas sp. TaxID=87 RepID=UPI0039194F32
MRHKNGFAGVTPAQQALVGYWQACRDSLGCVARDTINPGVFRSMLANISLVEIDAGGEGRFRIAGSRLRDLFGTEVRGRPVAEIAGAHGECYALGLSAAIERGEPVGGLIETGGRIHAWLRLPLAGEDGRLSQVLCHDELLTAAELRAIPALREGLIQQSGTRFAA